MNDQRNSWYTRSCGETVLDGEAILQLGEAKRAFAGAVSISALIEMTNRGYAALRDNGEKLTELDELEGTLGDGLDDA